MPYQHKNSPWSIITVITSDLTQCLHILETNCHTYSGNDIRGLRKLDVTDSYNAYRGVTKNKINFIWRANCMLFAVCDA
jgi:hypothetical protein